VFEVINALYNEYKTHCVLKSTSSEFLSR